MDRTCRLCTGRPGAYRTVTVGGGLSRRWAICDPCVDSLRGTDLVSVCDGVDPERVVLHVDGGTLVDLFERMGT